MSLLTICQNTVDVLGFGARPSSIVGNNDALARQMLAMVNTHCLKHITRRHTWQKLTSLHTITTVASDDSYALPSGFDRYIGDTFWDTTNYRRVNGAIGPKEWRYLKHAVVASPETWRKFRLYGGEVLIYPTPTANGDSIVAEYIVNTPCTSSDGNTAKTAFAADTDLFKLEDRLIELQLQWRLLKAKGLDYAEAFNDAERALELAIAQDAPASVVDMGAPMQDHPFPNIPPEIDA